MRFYVLAPWAWDREETKWRAPARNRLLGLIDLRSLPQQATPISAGGFGFFAYSEPVSIPGAIELGSSLDDALTTANKRQIERAIRSEGDWNISLGANTVRELLAEFLTVGADPTGQRFAKPLLSEEIHLGGVVWQGKVRDSPIWQANVLSVYQQDFQRLRQESGDTEHQRRVLGALDLRLRRYGLRARDIDPTLEPLPPSTTITESFNTGDSTTLGPDLTWTEITADLWEVVSNQVKDEAGVATLKMARADSDLSSADHYGQLIVESLGSGSSRMGSAARVQTDDTTTKTCYYANLRNNDDLELEKIVSGTDTELNATAQTVSLPDTVKVESNGSTIKSYFNGTEVASVTDTGITGYLRAGITARNASGSTVAAGDSFEAADLAGVETRSLAGSQPASTGTLVRVEQAPRAVAGGQPAATGALARIEQALRALAGDQPTATGILTRVFGQPRSLSGDQPESTGDLASVWEGVRALAGAQLAAAGTLATKLTAFKSLVGDQPAATGILTRIRNSVHALAGSQPAATGALARQHRRFSSIAGSQPSAIGSLAAALTVVKRALAGAQPTATGALTRIEKAVRAVAGSQPTATGALSTLGTFARALTGSQPSASGALTRSKAFSRSLAGSQPTATGALSVVTLELLAVPDASARLADSIVGAGATVSGKLVGASAKENVHIPVAIAHRNGRD